MSSIPSSLARVPNGLASQIVLQALQRTQTSLLTTQIQLATGRRVNHASDDPLATSVVSVLDDVVERREQWLRNLSHADAVLNNVDAALADATDLFIDAKGIASSQVGVGSDTETRRNQAAVIASLLEGHNGRNGAAGGCASAKHAKGNALSTLALAAFFGFVLVRRRRKD